MTSRCTEPESLHLISHQAEASSVVVHRVQPAQRERFVELQRGITAVAEQFPGYRCTEIYPPGDPSGDQWVVVIHFADRAALEHWLHSAERAQWVEKMTRETGDYKLTTLGGGFGPWFAQLAEGQSSPPPDWKMALTVWLGLYPTVMLLTLFVSPLTNPLGMAFSILIGNALSVSILQWIVMPWLTRTLRPWLSARENFAPRTIAATLPIVALLIAMALVFRQFSG